MPCIFMEEILYRNRKIYAHFYMQCQVWPTNMGHWYDKMGHCPLCSLCFGMKHQDKSRRWTSFHIHGLGLNVVTCISCWKFCFTLYDAGTKLAVRLTPNRQWHLDFLFVHCPAVGSCGTKRARFGETEAVAGAQTTRKRRARHGKHASWNVPPV